MKHIKMIMTFTLMTMITFISEAYANNRCLDHLNQRITNNSLYLSNCGLQDEDMPIILDFLASHQNINELDLSWNYFNDKGLIMLAANNTLYSLNLNSSTDKISRKAVTAFAKNTTLNTLYLHGLSNETAIFLAKSNTLAKLEAELNDIGPSGGVALAKNTSLTSLNISNSSIGIGDEGAAAFAKNTHLESLNVINNNISNAGFLLLAEHPTISALAIGERPGDNNKNLSTPVLNALAENPHLTSLNTFNIGGDAGAIILATSKSLVEVTLQYSKIHDEGAIAIASNPRITKLDLSENGISPKGVAALANMPALTRLDLDWTDIGIEGATELAKSKTLTELSLKVCDIDNGEAEALAKNHSIKKLMLYGNKISEEGAIALANNPTLTELDIGDSEVGIGTKGIQVLAQNTHLEKLYLSWTWIDAAAFTALADNMTLTELDISHDEISDEAILKFAASTHIRDLNLDENKLGDASAITLANNTNINSLDVGRNFIGEKGVQTLLGSSIAYLDVQTQGSTQ